MNEERTHGESKAHEHARACRREAAKMRDESRYFSGMGYMALSRAAEHKAQEFELRAQQYEEDAR